MATRIIPLKDLVPDPEQPADLTVLPAGEALARLRPAYACLGAGATVALADDLVTISVPDVPAASGDKRPSNKDYRKDTPIYLIPTELCTGPNPHPPPHRYDSACSVNNLAYVPLRANSSA